MFVKICGLKTERAVQAAVDAGADALGFVFADSPRKVSPEQAAALTRGLPAGIARVAVMLRPSVEEWQRVHDVFRPDWLQTDADDYPLLRVPETIGRLPVFRDGHLGDINVDQFDWPAYIVFEGARSGAGMQPDWDCAARIATHTCLMLAGGLDPQNVAAAITHVHPWGVDVSSGVESSPGNKDPGRIAAFIAAARETEETHAG